MKPLNLYIHIPYCKYRCRYCNFYVVAGRTPQLPLYFKALKKELETYASSISLNSVDSQKSEYEIKTIYFGGGTPSLVDSKSIVDFVKYIKQNYRLAEDLDISIEVNPENITKKKLDDYYNCGIRRISIGLQAWQDNILKYMGRLYTIEEFLEYYKVIKQSRFENINVDLIFGIPNQTLEEWKESVDNVIKLNPKHISCYSLEVDERSIYGVMEQKGLFKRANEELDREMYLYARRALQTAGFKHYEISNFAKPGFESNHNLSVWNGEEYIGLGASAHSYFNGHRFNNVLDVDGYVIKTLKGESAKEGLIDIDKNHQMLEFILLQLRLIEGLSFEKFEKKFGVKFQEKYSIIITELITENLATTSKRNLVLTDKGLDLESYVLSKFL